MRVTDQCLHLLRTHLEGAGHYLGIAVVEIRGQEAVGEVAFDEARRCEFLQQGQGERRSREDSQVSGPF